MTEIHTHCKLQFMCMCENNFSTFRYVCLGKFAILIWELDEWCGHYNELVLFSLDSHHLALVTHKRHTHRVQCWHLPWFFFYIFVHSYKYLSQCACNVILCWKCLFSHVMRVCLRTRTDFKIDLIRKTTIPAHWNNLQLIVT